jgi:hypothetical protein
LLVLVVYLPALSGQFLSDDDSNVTKRAPLRSFAGLSRIWFEPGATQQYYPLTHTSFWLDYHLWGLNPFGYHVENVLLHALSSILLWLTLRRLAVKGAWLGAALFALHPVCVESVAWITERKNTLSAFFFLSAILASLEFWLPQSVLAKTGPNRPGLASDNPYGPRKFYWLTFVLYLCALWSKTATVALPVIVLLLLWWKRGGFARRNLIFLVPFFAAGTAMGLITMWVESHDLGATGLEWEGISRLQRGLIGARALWFYLGKLFWPHPLMFMYPRWNVRAGDPLAYLPLAAGIALLLLLWRYRQGWGRPVLFVAAYFVCMLVPLFQRRVLPLFIRVRSFPVSRLHWPAGFARRRNYASPGIRPATETLVGTHYLCPVAAYPGSPFLASDRNSPRPGCSLARHTRPQSGLLDGS